MASDMGNAKKYSRSVPTLADTIGFNDDELEQNRDGYLSERQREELLTDAQSRSTVMIVVTLALGIAAVIAVLDSLRMNIPYTGHPILLIIFAFVEIGAFAQFGLPIPRYRQDAAGVAADSVQGHVRLSIGGNSRKRIIYTITIGGIRFAVGKPILLAFKNDEPYAVYFAPRSRKLLSAEWLREPAEV